MFEVRQSSIYRDWFDRLRDRQAKARIDSRISRLSMGNAGDAKSVGSGVSELRIDYGPGYRVYFSRKGKTLILLLCGGDKRTQQADIERASDRDRKALDRVRNIVMATKRTGRKPAAKKSASTSRITFSKWDVADHLRTEADILAYFEACLEEAGDDPSFIAAALGDIARARGMSRVARDSGLTREGLYRALGKGSNPSLGTVLKVTRALGLKLRAEVA